VGCRINDRKRVFNPPILLRCIGEYYYYYYRVLVVLVGERGRRRRG